MIGDLTEVWGTRPERTMSGVVRGLAESSVPGETLTGGKEAESILQGIWKPIRA